MSMMKSNFKELVSIEKLKIANDCCKKWADRLGIKKNDYVKFVIDLKKNPNDYKQKLPVQYRSQFSKDHKVMFYAMEVENIIIEQYYNTVTHIINKIKVKECFRDDFLAIGLTAIRSSIFNYRTHKVSASFFTFCFNGVFRKLVGTKYKMAMRMKKKKGLQFTATDMSKSESKPFRIGEVPGASVNYDQNFESQEAELQKDQIIYKSGLTDDEIYLVKLYMTRNTDNPKWNQVYRNYHINKTGKSISKQGVFVKLYKAQKKMWFTFTEITKRPFFDTKNKFQTYGNQYIVN